MSGAGNALTPDLLAAYQAKYGIAPTPAAISLFNHQNATAGDWNDLPSGGTGGGPTPQNLGAAGVPTAQYTPPSDGILGFIAKADSDIPLLGALDNAFNLNPNTSGSLTATNGPVAGVAGLLKIVTDLPRMVTIIAGLILLIAGLFMLGSGPAVQVVGALKKHAGAIAEIAA